MPPWRNATQRRLYERLISEALPDRTRPKIRVNTEGWQHVVFEVDREFIFRFPRSAQHARLLAMEARLLPCLAARLPVPVPDPFVVGSLPGPRSWPFLAYRRIPGVPLDWDRMGARSRRRLVRELVPALHHLARFPVREALQLGVPGGGPKSWKANHEKEYRRFRTKGYRVMSPGLRRAVDAVFRRYLDDPRNFRWRPVLLHREIHAGHVLTVKGHVSGIIDWGYACVGDPAREFAAWSAHFGSDGLPALSSAHRAENDETFDERVALYGTLIPVYHILGGIEVGDRRMVRSGLGFLERALQRSPDQGWSSRRAFRS